MGKEPLLITQLGYVGIEATDIEAWRQYARDFLGMHVVDVGANTLHLRMDERPFRLIVTRGIEMASPAWVWRQETLLPWTACPHDWQPPRRSIQRGSEQECRTRRVAALNWFRDPDGNRIELFHGPLPEPAAFTPAGGIGGFRTGDLGLGHVVLQTPNIEAMSAFYLELGFRLSDYMESPIDARFLHTNARHHSLALLHAPEAKIHHIMIEYLYLDDVGRLYDRAQASPDRIVTTLGRHANDHMLSFYSRTPGGFMIETGWAGRLIDPDTWQQERISTPSLWGPNGNGCPRLRAKRFRPKCSNWRPPESVLR